MGTGRLATLLLKCLIRDLLSNVYYPVLSSTNIVKYLHLFQTFQTLVSIDPSINQSINQILFREVTLNNCKTNFFYKPAISGCGTQAPPAVESARATKSLLSRRIAPDPHL